MAYNSNNYQITWLDYTIMNNPNGVLKVLSDFGYIGMLAPQTIEQVKENSLDIIDQYGDEGVVALLKAHPEFPAFEELFSGNKYSNTYRNAIGGVATRIDSFISKLRPIDQAFVAIGVFVAVYYMVAEVKK